MNCIRGAVIAVVLCGCPKPMPMMDGGVDAGPVFTVVETCEQLAAARCTLKQRCYAAFNRDGVMDCNTLEQSRCLAEYETLKSSYEAGLVTVDSQRVETCKQRMLSSACPPSFPPDYPNITARPFSDCSWNSGLFVGKLKSGEICDNHVECAPGTLCIKPGGVCRGTCSSYSADKEPCAFGCSPGMYCDRKGDRDPNNDVCAPLKGLNSPCASSVECEEDFICDVTCRPRGKENEACWFDSTRLSTCEPGLACDVVPFVKDQIGTCVRPKAEFEACKFHWTCQPGLVCADIDWTGFPRSAPAMPGSCRQPGGLASNCAATVWSLYVGDPCAAGTRCALDTKQCTVIPKFGETCAPSTQVCAGPGVYCKPTGGEIGICSGPSGQGDRCAFAIDPTTTVQIPCSSGWCDATTTLECKPPFRTINEECESNGECVSGRCAVLQDSTFRCAMSCD